MKKLMLWMGLITWVVLLPTGAFATLVVDESFDYSLCCGQGGDVAYVNSWVDYDDVDTYTYYYQILDVAPEYSINYFQFEIPETEYSTLNEAAVPTTSTPQDVYGYWFALTNPDSTIAYGMAALFPSPVIEGKISYTLSFESQLAPTESAGQLSGFGPDGTVCLCGELFTPIPEPATMALLALGAGFAIKRKKRD